MTFICGSSSMPGRVGRALLALGSCCLDAVEGTLADCTCWEPEYDLDQAPLVEGVEAVTRDKMCGDCACRPDSPERTGDERYQHTDGDVGALPSFWCHQGMRRVVRWRHPSGLTIEADSDDYHPPMRTIRGAVPVGEAGETMVVSIAVPYKADGTPADRCAGWAAHQEARA